MSKKMPSKKRKENKVINRSQVILGLKALEVFSDARYSTATVGEVRAIAYAVASEEELRKFADYCSAIADYDEEDDVEDEDAFDNGYAAQKDGSDKTTNPHTPDTTESILWDKGWQLGANEDTYVEMTLDRPPPASESS